MQQYLFHRLETSLSLETISDAMATDSNHTSEIVDAIRNLISSEKIKSFSQEDDENDDEYSLKVGMVCFSTSGRYFGSEPPDVPMARRWAKVWLSFNYFFLHAA